MALSSPDTARLDTRLAEEYIPLCFFNSLDECLGKNYDLSDREAVDPQQYEKSLRLFGYDLERVKLERFGHTPARSMIPGKTTGFGFISETWRYMIMSVPFSDSLELVTLNFYSDFRGEPIPEVVVHKMMLKAQDGRIFDLSAIIEHFGGEFDYSYVLGIMERAQEQRGSIQTIPLARTDQYIDRNTKNPTLREFAKFMRDSEILGLIEEIAHHIQYLRDGEPALEEDDLEDDSWEAKADRDKLVIIEREAKDFSLYVYNSLLNYGFNIAPNLTSEQVVNRVNFTYILHGNMNLALDEKVKSMVDAIAEDKSISRVALQEQIDLLKKQGDVPEVLEYFETKLHEDPKTEI